MMLLNNQHYCPGCGSNVVFTKAISTLPNSVTGWYDHGYFAKCTGCGVMASGESSNVFRLFPERKAVTEEYLRGYEEGYKASQDTDYKQMRFDF